MEMFLTPSVGSLNLICLLSVFQRSLIKSDLEILPIQSCYFHGGPSFLDLEIDRTDIDSMF
jgi:hypothetical protein